MSLLELEHEREVTFRLLFISMDVPIRLSSQVPVEVIEAEHRSPGMDMVTLFEIGVLTRPGMAIGAVVVLLFEVVGEDTDDEESLSLSSENVTGGGLRGGSIILDNVS